MPVNTYYFDGSDSGATDPDGVWTNDANAFDGSISDFAYTQTIGSTSSNYLMAEGTDAPASGGTISQVRARIHWSSDGFDEPAGAYKTEIWTNGKSELLGTISVGNGSGGSPEWSSYLTLSAPTGGWSWSVIQALETYLYATAGSMFDWSISKVEIEVTSEDITTYTSPFPAFRA